MLYIFNGFTVNSVAENQLKSFVFGHRMTSDYFRKIYKICLRRDGGISERYGEQRGGVANERSIPEGGAF